MKQRFIISAFAKNGGLLMDKVPVKSTSVQAVCRALLGSRFSIEVPGLRMETRIARIEFHSQERLTTGKN